MKRESRPPPTALFLCTLKTRASSTGSATLSPKARESPSLTPRRDVMSKGTQNNETARSNSGNSGIPLSARVLRLLSAEHRSHGDFRRH